MAFRLSSAFPSSQEAQLDLADLPALPETLPSHPQEMPHALQNHRPGSVGGTSEAAPGTLHPWDVASDHGALRERAEDPARVLEERAAPIPARKRSASHVQQSLGIGV